jgi:hypothetical protein
MGGTQDQSATLADRLQPGLNFGSLILKGAKGQRMLFVDRAPEAQPVAVLSF